MNSEQLAYAYATLLLVDAELPTSAENVEKVLKGANLKVNATQNAAFQRIFAHTPASKLVPSLGGGIASGSATAATAQKTAPTKAAAKEVPKEEPKKEEEEDFDMGDLFG
ncbi:hypothetical protein IMG5_092200 [Ichthyophthirius multifiliis]|uniref:60S acidic ribosomal protein P1 n=1 Tax=Ichthyophthirius multifiliis TaxID=5932 RepID=G0QRE6_ICHMU|nr:hypothetical protein IMG5_092200 [Ichthyophthirius multifiliis]EGR32215.1 hypothetical protein IMG5_092200 [Ichthyophthirius multifiliis]|eukprot:XP_004035701.1 hypothetical protein IMG5_092200 [Ichthyophthirius multifiliis]